MTWTEVLGEGAIDIRLYVSLATVATLYLANVAITSINARRPYSRELAAKKWELRVRFFLGMAAFVFLAIVWGSQLRAFALSVLALGAASVLALKEPIENITGGLTRVAANSFALGDRISVGGMQGDVISVGTFSVRLLEVGADHRRTGRTLTVPNTLFHKQIVRNASIGNRFVFHTVEIPVGPGADWRKAESAAMRIAKTLCAPFRDDAEAALTTMAARHNIERFVVDPWVMIQSYRDGSKSLMMRVPCETGKVADWEQAFLREFLELRIV